MEDKKPELYALILAGGHSRRMGQDKAHLIFNHRTQLVREIELAMEVCPSVFLSLRADQALPIEAEEAGMEAIRDRHGEIGPLGAILSAMETYPQKAWFVIAIDLPLLDLHTLEMLVAGRDPATIATAYRNPATGDPHPMCTIYEPSARPVIEDFLFGRDIRDAQQLLLHAEPAPKTVPLDNPRALDGVNTPGDYDRIVRRLSAGV